MGKEPSVASPYLFSQEKVAIIGMGCRFPGGSNDYSLFWKNLRASKDCIIPTPENRYSVSQLYSKNKAKSGRLTGGRGGYIDGFDEFDPAFFGIGPREAECMDPQQRKLLEVAWEALEDAGQKPLELAGFPIGVFIGGFTLDYKIVQFADLSFKGISAHTATGTMMTMLSNRISYCFDFNGPSMSIDTACSSSLVAVHLACQSLQKGESSIALAGGVLLHMTPQYSVAESKGGFLSPEGSSRTFDASANGYVRSEGVGVVVLKKLSDAIRDKDTIHAVILGTGVNQDGRTNGITSPNGDAQTRLIRQVSKQAGIKPGDLQYVEAHGTSTPLGDPIEANALSQVLAEGRKADSPAYVGSVKTNIGHTESAAGIAGLIKTVMSLKHKEIPEHLHLETLNPAIDLSSQSVQIPRSLTPWFPPQEGPRLAGVNSFGFGGTNAFAILEEAPHIDHSQNKAPHHSVLTLTARDPSYFPEMVTRIRERILHLDPTQESLEDIAYTLASRRQSLESNLSFVYSNKEELISSLDSFLKGDADPRLFKDEKRDDEKKKLVWVFTGMGPQWWAMGRQLYQNEPVYRECIQRCDAEIRKFTDWSLVEELNAEEASSQMSETWLAQPANFALQIALADLWRSYGIKPDAIVGHSTGEAAAFYEAGVYSLEDAVKVIVHRSRLQQTLIDTGTMLAVSLTEEDAQGWIAPYGNRISIAAINSPTSLTLSGDLEPLRELSEVFKAKEVFNKFLTVKVPYHSAKMDLIKEELLLCLNDIHAAESKLPLYLTGRNGKAQGPELDAQYWWENVRYSVRFKDAIDSLLEDDFDLFLEIGPHPVLSFSISECASAKQKSARTLASIRRQEDESQRFLGSLASLHNMGFSVDWSPLFKDCKAVPLPTYPWKKDRYWTESKDVEQVRLGQIDHPLLGRRLAKAEASWELSLDIEKESYLEDHQIQGNIVFPAAGYMEMASQALRAMTGGNAARITDLEFRKALFVPSDEVKSVVFSFHKESASFTITSASASEASLHARGNFSLSQKRVSSDILALEAIQKRCFLFLEGSECYRLLAQMGYHYGPAFQAIERLWIGEGEVLARIVPTKSISHAEASDYHAHPVLIDACFQTLLTIEIPSYEKGETIAMRLPLTISEFHTDRIGSQTLLVHSRVKFRSKEELVGDISIYDESGKSLGLIQGFRALDLEKAATNLSLSTIDSSLTELAWTEAPSVPIEESQFENLDSVLIFASSSPLAERLSLLFKNAFIISAADEFFYDEKHKKAHLLPSKG